MEERDFREEPAPNRDRLLEERFSTRQKGAKEFKLKQNGGQPADDLHHERVRFFAVVRVKLREADQHVDLVRIRVESVG